MSIYHDELTTTRTVPLVKLEDYSKQKIQTAHLILVKSPDHLKLQKLYPVRRPIILGRQESADIYLDDPKISRHHAQIYHDGKNFYIKDLNSTNGIKVNGERVREKKISPKDLIEIGDLSFEFNYPKIVPSKHKNSKSKHWAIFKILKAVLLTAVVSLSLALIYYSATHPFKKDTNRAPMTIGKSETMSDAWSETRAQIYFGVAVDSYGAGDYEKAHHFVNRAKELFPSSDKVEALDRAINEASEIKTFYKEKTVEIEKENVKREQLKDYFSTARGHIDHREWDLAIIAYQDALLVDANNDEAKVGISNVEQLRQDRRDFVKNPKEAHPSITFATTLEIYQKMNQTLAKAQELAKQGQYLMAIEEYKTALNLAKRHELDIQPIVEPMVLCAQEFKDKVSVLWTEAQTLFDAQKYRESKEKVEALIKIFPTHAEALKKKEEVDELLNKHAQSLYSKAHVFESMPDIEAAKEKWTEIISLVTPDHPYYHRAQKKLTQYSGY